VLLATTTAERYRAPEADYRPHNLVEYAEATGEFADVLEDTIVHPGDDFETLMARFESECAAAPSETPQPA
jgi:hypothetical protein